MLGEPSPSRASIVPCCPIPSPGAASATLPAAEVGSVAERAPQSFVVALRTTTLDVYASHSVEMLQSLGI